MRHMFAVLCAIGLVGCSTAPLLSPDDAQALMLAECGLYVKASGIAQSRGVPNASSIAEGCGGARPSAVAGIANFGSAMTGAAPPNLTSFGTGGERLYRKMIARGAPQELATEMTRTPEFAQASKLMTKALGG